MCYCGWWVMSVLMSLLQICLEIGSFIPPGIFASKFFLYSVCSQSCNKHMNNYVYLWYCLYSYLSHVYTRSIFWHLIKTVPTCVLGYWARQTWLNGLQISLPGNIHAFRERIIPQHFVVPSQHFFDRNSFYYQPPQTCFIFPLIW